MERQETIRMDEPKSLWNMSYILALVISTITAFSFYLNQSLLAGYLQSPEIGISAQVAGVIVGLFSFTSLFCHRMADPAGAGWPASVLQRDF